MNSKSGNNLDCDIVIVGGGPVGLLMHRLLADLPLSVTLIEKRAELVNDADPRSYILNRGLIDSLLNDGVISVKPEDRHELRELIVSSAAGPVKFRLSAPEQGRCLKYVIGAAPLQRALAEAVADKSGIRTGCGVSAMELRPEGVDIELDGDGGPAMLRSRIAIIADGAQSRMAALLGIESQRTASQHSALVLSMATDRKVPHQAEQCLTARGPISIVPGRGGRMVGIIVSDSSDYLESLASPAAINELMEKIFHGRYGPLEQVSKPAIFPMQPLRRPCRRQRALIIGDACCALSPVAAQGLSLGMDSAIQLSASFASRRPDLANTIAWDDFASAWERRYQSLYATKQNLNQFYARAIMSLGPLARPSLAPAMALLGLSPLLRRKLVALLSE